MIKHLHQRFPIILYIMATSQPIRFKYPSRPCRGTIHRNGHNDAEATFKNKSNNKLSQETQVHFPGQSIKIEDIQRKTRTGVTPCSICECVSRCLFLSLTNSFYLCKETSVWKLMCFYVFIMYASAFLSLHLHLSVHVSIMCVTFFVFCFFYPDLLIWLYSTSTSAKASIWATGTPGSASEARTQELCPPGSEERCRTGPRYECHLINFSFYMIIIIL